jgi:3-oxosteroid 1-dehydrogenase
MTWDYTTDLLVVGSGAGGMTAAIVAADLGSTSLVIEKADCYGGTTALSGGGIWIPANDAMLAAGLSDSEEEAVKYLQQVIGSSVSEKKIRAYVRHGREMVRFLDQRTPVKFSSSIYYYDYYPEFVGGKTGGRTMDPMPFNFD